MNATAERTTGGCLCGRVRYEAEGRPLVVGICHCRSCRRHTGAALVAFVAFDAANVRFPDTDRAIYESSPGVGRGFCQTCGTPLTWEGPFRGTRIIEFHISTTDSPEAYAPDVHWHYAERLPWVDLPDTLPRYAGSESAGEPIAHGPPDRT